MQGKELLFVKLVIILFGRSSLALQSHCDRATTARVQEGNLGQTPDFNWLGVLRVHMHEGEKLKVAVSGIVLIKDNYALANADDVARIPRDVFESDTKAMFIPEGDSPLFVKTKSYVIHPEYDYATINTIALIELNTEDNVEGVALNPICFPEISVNVSSYVYLTGFTDENQLFEKVFYKMQYLEKKVCAEFYNRAGLTTQKQEPTSYFCGYTPFNKTNCNWDNGMVLVSNATGWFTLIGFGLRGPGCAAPARFIDMSSYFHWISVSTSNQDMIYDYPEYRRLDGMEFLPEQELFNQLMRNVGPKNTTSASKHQRHFAVQPFSNHTIQTINA